MDKDEIDIAPYKWEDVTITVELDGTEYKVPFTDFVEALALYGLG